MLGPKERARKETSRLNGFLTGVEDGVRDRREETCLQSLLDHAGLLVGRFYVQEAFTGSSSAVLEWRLQSTCWAEQGKEYAESIIKAVIGAFQDRLPDLDWLDDATRKAAHDKVRCYLLLVRTMLKRNL